MINACIVETRYRAGVYEDKDLLQYNPYVKNAKIEEFPSFEHALAEFERRYGNIISKRGFYANCMYKVRDDHDYVIFSNGYFAGFCREDLYWDILPKVAWQTETRASFVCEGGYTYKEAKHKIEKILYCDRGHMIRIEKIEAGKGYRIPGTHEETLI